MNRSAVIPSLFASDLPETLCFYVEQLGFIQTGEYRENDEPATWAEVSLGEARIWFFGCPLDEHPTPVFSGLVYVFVPDVDELAARLRGKLKFEWGPETQAYGLRELGIRDPNGYYLVFAADG
ncbi:MAG: VOC family protein [Gammaproteobacteria bacterium]|nr:VOC family protein [Gammaproteobacteria bacterium]